MNKEISNMIKLIRSGITGESIDESIDDYECLISIALKHRCLTVLQYAFANNGIELKNDLCDNITNIVFNEVVANEQQLFSIEEISKEFNEKKIKHIFLKGSVLKKLYPYTEMRRMGDIDILIKNSQYKQITTVMEKLGYCYDYESDYEVVWKKGLVRVELHRELIPRYNKDLYSYFGDGWEKAVLKEKSCYTFSAEDMFIYIFSHFAKHYRDAGIGIIHFCDLYVYLNSYNLDFKYINAELEKLHLYTFWCNIKDTIYVWFMGKKSTEMTEHITNVLINSGVYGLKENSNISRALKSKKRHGTLKKGKIYRKINSIFPPYSAMKRKYRLLKKLPIFLPFFWIMRWIFVFFGNPQKIKYTLSNISDVNDDEVITYQKKLKYVGLDYNF